MSSAEAAPNEENDSAFLDAEPVSSSLTIIDVVLIGGLTFSLSFVFGLAYGVYLGTQGYTSQEIVGHF
tara:strand:- start:3505 stop:3708 length:204 start_codon:yes stop_codon:yes gene_type:complete